MSSPTLKTAMKTTTYTSNAAPAHNAPLPPSTTSAGRSSRIAPHSHIKGLGLTSEGYAAVDGAGFIGQTNAREVRRGFCGDNVFFFYLAALIIGLWRGRRSRQITKILW